MLNQKTLPAFSHILPETIEAELKRLINDNRHFLSQLLQRNQTITWDNFILPLEEKDDQLMKMWSPIAHLYSVAETPALRAAYHACLSLLTEYHTELRQNENLFKAIQVLGKGGAFYSELNPAQRKIIDNEIRDFKLSGIDLSPEKKARFGEIQKQLSKLSAQFSENVLDATQGWYLHVTDSSALIGIPPAAQQMAEQNAKDKDLEGWVFTLDYPSYSTVMKSMANRELRWLMYEAYATRASDQGPYAGRWDNNSVMETILTARQEMARLVGFENYAGYSLATKMAAKPERVLSFLNDLVVRSKAIAQQEIQELAQLAKRDGVQQLEAWDLAYYSEKMRQEKFAISQEELRSYFPAPKVLAGMFAVVNKLFGMTVVERQGVDVWHPQVQFFEIGDEKKQLRGCFYIDLYARAHKREGAWMDDCCVRRKTLAGNMQMPVAFLTCNFNRPLGNKPAMLTHEDVQTLFHEFGHCLHHLLTQVEYGPVSGINGVLWDAVEFPSQLFEHWCWEKEVIQLISAHEDSGESLPDALFHKLMGVKNFQAGLQMLRQLEFALFDFRVHQEFLPAKGIAQVQKILNEVREQVAVVPTPVFNRFQNSFSHIFSGGYAAGYYSYKWAEVLACDAFSLFAEKGIFDRVTGEAFLRNILEQGGTRDPMELFVAFRGREPKVDALLEYSGLL